VPNLIVLILQIFPTKNAMLKTNRVDHSDMLPNATKSWPRLRFNSQE